MKKNLEEAYKNMQFLNRNERTEVAREILDNKPEFMKNIKDMLVPSWWYFAKCEVHVLLVCDGGLNFGPSSFGLSEFITSFPKLEATSFTNIRYKVTLAHRSASPSGVDPMLAANTAIVNRITGFNFSTSVNLQTFDQVWMFGINAGASSLTAPELTAITTFMNGGGGVFATGDHGSLGSAMCSAIPRVKDMRHWADTSTINDVNEVSMSGKRRNDTNRPAIGATVSNNFDNQSDNIPQNIAVRTFGGGQPHPLLSISTAIRPSGIIDIMPDHPHEGECKQESVFTVLNPVTNLNQNVASQIVATSFVLGGSFAAGKAATDPHCFPSIHVFDGRVANVGRIVIDSTWHHFVNINLNGVGSSGTGLDLANFTVVQQYYMNIARWMSRKKIMLCKYRFILVDLLFNSQLIEASLNNPVQKLEEIELHDLNSIGKLAEEILANGINAGFAKQFMLDMLEPVMPELAQYLDPYKPADKERKTDDGGYYQDWVNLDLIVGTAIGAGFIALRDNPDINSGKITEKTMKMLYTIFDKGAVYGAKAAVANLERNYNSLSDALKDIK